MVHFLFTTGLPTKISPFARKYSKFLDGSLAAFEAAEREQFAGYAERLASEQLEEGETNPVEYGEMPFFHCDLTGGLHRLAFSTADDPFYKTSESKYYPEAVVFDAAGKILARVSPDNRSSAEYHMTYSDDVRDNVLKINDDRKIQISFNQIKEPGTMILLTVRQFVPKDGRTVGKEGEFDRAWFRLANEDTNQTLDYCMLKKVELPEDYQELIPAEEEEDAPPFRNTLTYVAGALFLDPSRGTPQWVFESYKNVLQAKDLKDVGGDAAAALGELYARATAEFEEQQKVLADASNALKKSLEEKKQQQLEAAKKAAKQAKGGKKGAKKEAEEEPGEAERAASKLEEEAAEVFDPYLPASFEKALKAKIPRPFIFGPVEFEGLNLTEEEAPFEPEAQREKVAAALERGIYLPPNVCIHGFKVKVKNRTLKRRSSLLKHARFL